MSDSFYTFPMGSSAFRDKIREVKKFCVFARKLPAIAALAFVACAGVVHAQTDPGHISPAASTLSSGSQSEGDANSRTWKNVLPDILYDQKDIYVGYPSRLLHGKDWLPTVAIVGSVAALAASDQFDAPTFRRTTALKHFNDAFSGTNTAALIVAVPAATYAFGMFSHDQYAESTALLAGEAAVDGAIADEVMKLVTHRQRPEYISPKGNFADNWFEAKASDGSFPSGHAIAAFSVATIMSRRYGHTHRWVPYVSYGVASAIGVSRVTLSAHYVSDVAMGAALGYVISRFVVLRPQ